MDLISLAPTPRPPLPASSGVHLKDFDLAGGGMEVLRVLSTVSLGERVDLDPEGDALLPAMLPGSELCADAVHLQTGAQAFYECTALKVAPPTGGTKR